MKAIGRIFGTFITIILVFTSLICLLASTFLTSTKNILSTDIVADMVKQIDFKELMGEQVHEEISSVLEQAGIPSEYVDYILEDEELKEYMGNYMAEGLDYILYEKELPVISEQEVTNLLSNSFDQVITELENHNIEVSTYLTKEQQAQVHEQIEIYVPQVVEKIPEVESLIEDKISENEEVQNAKQKLEELRNLNEKIQFVYQMQPTILLLAILQLAFIIVLKRKDFRFIKWLFLPFMALAVILGILNAKAPTLVKQYYPEEMGFMKSFIDNALNSIFGVWRQSAQIYFILAILLIVAQITVIGVSIYKNRRRKDMDVL
mgnify:CR=1 FL=1